MRRAGSIGRRSGLNSRTPPASQKQQPTGLCVQSQHEQPAACQCHTHAGFKRWAVQLSTPPPAAGSPRCRSRHWGLGKAWFYRRAASSGRKGLRRWWCLQGRRTNRTNSDAAAAQAAPSALPLPSPATGAPRATLAQIPVITAPRGGRLTVQHVLSPRSQRE